jgi:hypothetical protein
MRAGGGDQPLMGAKFPSLRKGAASLLRHDLVGGGGFVGHVRLAGPANGENGLAGARPARHLPDSRRH